MKRSLQLLTLLFITSALFGQQGTFIALDNLGNLYSVNVNSCNKTQLTFCNNFIGKALSIGLFGSTLYINDNKGNLYSNTLGNTGTTNNCNLLGGFISGSTAIYGLTVGPDGIVYAASGNLIETYNPATRSFGTLGSLPANLIIGGDLLFYNGVLYEVCTNINNNQSVLIAVNLSNPASSTIYLQFTKGTSIYGLATVTVPCSNNQLYAVSKSGQIYLVDMTAKTQAAIPSCSFGIDIYDAASVAETQSTAPPLAPNAISPVIFCVNSTATPLTASASNTDDTLKWYTQSVGGTSTAAPTPSVGSIATTDTFYVSQIDTATQCEGARTMIVVEVDTFSAPTINITASSTRICSGDSVQFKATSFNGGTHPIYQWQINGNNVGDDSSVYIVDTLLNNYKVLCIMTSNSSCATIPTATSNLVVIDTASKIIPLISIVASDTSFCPGTTVTFNAIPINGGTLPLFLWKLNGTIVGSNNSVYTTATLNNGDTISCYLISNVATCLNNDTAISNKIRLSVTAKILPTITIVTNNTNICSGTPVTFTSTESDGGTAPNYQWRINGKNVNGSDSSVFTTTALKNYDIVTCKMISNEDCLISNSAISNAISVLVASNPMPTITVTASDTTPCNGDSVLLTATIQNGGSSPSYQWKVNGINSVGNSNAITQYVYNNTDTFSCMLITKNTTCSLSDTVTSNIVTIAPLPLTAAATIHISTDTTIICSGNPTIFSATATYGGVFPVYQWKVNDTDVGIDSSKFTTATLSNGDIVSCSLSSSITCLASKNAASNPLTITVISTPVLQAIKGDSSICQGKISTFTDSTKGGIWKSSATDIATIDSIAGIVTALKAGASIVYYSQTNSCGSTIKSVVLNVVDSPFVYPFDGKTSVCINDTIELSDIIKGGTWSTLDTTIANINEDGIVTGISNGNASIHYAVTNGCGTASYAQSIYIAGEKINPKSYSIKQPTCISPMSGGITINITGKESPYQYKLNGNYYDNSVQASNLAAGIYRAYIYNGYNCLVDSVTDIILQLSIDASCDTLYVPSGFAPKSNNPMNRVLKPFGGSSAIESLSFKIYNRYGNLVFESHDLNIGWDGKINGTLQSNSTYVWYLDYTSTTGGDKQKHMKGTSVLIQ